jgi:hypothetical protein
MFLAFQIINVDYVHLTSSSLCGGMHGPILWKIPCQLNSYFSLISKMLSLKICKLVSIPIVCILKNVIYVIIIF